MIVTTQCKANYNLSKDTFGEEFLSLTLATTLTRSLCSNANFTAPNCPLPITSSFKVTSLSLNLGIPDNVVSNASFALAVSLPICLAVALFEPDLAAEEVPKNCGLLNS